MIVLVGFMGAGKSTAGPELAAILGLPFVDTDARIEERARVFVAEIFETAGEAAFRELERECVAEVLAGDSAVVALGGGAVTDAATRAALRDCDVVFLKTDLEECLRRVGDDRSRPLLRSADLPELFKERNSVYEACADHVVDTGGRTASQTAEEIAARLRSGSMPPPRRIPVDVPGSPYSVLVGAGLLARLDDELPGLIDGLGRAEKAIVVTHPSLEAAAVPAMEALSRLGLESVSLTVPEGESTKTLGMASELFLRLAGAGAHRHDLLVAFGGGVVTDLGGFVASTYHRGMPLLNVPTTLLGQVDAAIGGKNGVNLPHGKNLVGTIWQPAAVVCDVALLDTLDDAELRAGLAEVIKYGFIELPELLETIREDAERLFERDAGALAGIVEHSVRIKAGIVAADEREAGVRAHLNYGHTFAHAIENASGYEGIRHGEAVALGMMAAAYLARELGRLDDDAVGLHRSVLESVGLPTSAPGLQLDLLERAWRHDKKYRGGVRFVLLSEIGKPEYGVEATRQALERALERMKS